MPYPTLDKMMTTQGDNFVINELIREYLEWNGCGNAADVLVCEDGFSFVGFLEFCLGSVKF